MANIITAIDIGSSKITAVIAVVEDNNKAKVIGEASYPSYGVKKGEITGIDEAVNSIASALSGAERMAGLTVSSAYVTINGKQIISNNNKGVVAISDSEITDEDVFRALEQARTVAIPATREIIHLIPREFVVDQQSGIKVPIGMTGSRLEVDSHIISAPVTSKHNLEKCIQSIGLRIDGIVFSGWSAAQSILTPTEKELGVLLLDIGGGTVSITTFVEDAVTYSTAIPYGGTNITRDLAAGLRLQLDDAEKVKIHAEELFKNADLNAKKVDRKNVLDKPIEEEEKTEGRDKPAKKSDILDVTALGIEGVKTISRRQFNEIVEARITEMFELVVDNIEAAGYEYQLPAGVVLTGGTALVPGITAIAKKVFKVPARIGFPRGLDGLTDGVSSPSFASSQGLVLYALHDEIYRGDNRFTVSSNSKQGPGIVNKVTKFFKGLMP